MIFTIYLSLKFEALDAVNCDIYLEAFKNDDRISKDVKFRNTS